MDRTSRRQFLTRTGASGGLLAATDGLAAPPESPTPMNDTDPETLRARLVECLGGPWPEPCPLRPEGGEPISREGYRIEPVSYEVEPGDRVPAYLLVPDSASEEALAPAVAVWHQHGGNWQLGKSEPAGLDGDPMHHTGAALAREGYAVLCPDALCFEDRQNPGAKLEGGAYERFEFLRHVVAGRCMAWKNVLDMRRAVDFLAERPEVDANRLGCYGHSMGSTHTWLVGPHEPRLKALVGNCCLPTYAAIHEHELLHCFPNFVPGWAQYGDTPEMAALIAPRALHLNLGETDRGSPIEHARAGVERIAAAYAARGTADRFTHFVEPDTGHVLSDAMWERVRAFFARELGAVKGFPEE